MTGISFMRMLTPTKQGNLCKQGSIYPSLKFRMVKLFDKMGVLKMVSYIIGKFY